MSSSRAWDLQVDPGIPKVLKRMPRRDVEVILDVIRFLSSNPYFGDIQKMKGENNVWRRCVGSYRIFYKVKTAEKIVLVFRLERRTSATY